jgi:hypothetical protein
LDTPEQVKTFWTQKATYDEVQIKAGKAIDSMAEFIYIHFMKIYGKDQSVVSEWACVFLTTFTVHRMVNHCHVIVHRVVNHCHARDRNKYRRDVHPS